VPDCKWREDHVESREKSGNVDYSLSEDQEAIRELAKNIISRHCTSERLKALEERGEIWDRDLWTRLAEAGLLGLALPIEVDGSGFGLIEICVLLIEQAKRVATLPILPCLIMGAMPISRFGSEELRRKWLPGVVTGSTILTAALDELRSVDAWSSSVVAVRDGESWRLSGERFNVPYLEFADGVIVAARVSEDTHLFLVDPKSKGVRTVPVVTTDKQPASNMYLENTSVDRSNVVSNTNGSGEEFKWLVENVLVGLCAIQAGVADEALRMTAEYTSQREQFGKKISTFQAVSMRAANCYVDVKVMYATMWQAAWRLATGCESKVEVEVAKWWSAEAGQRVVHECQHLHGGIGADVSYPLHRYFLWAKHAELTLGSGHLHAHRLGQLLAQRDWPIGV
jgi:3-oxocholest-4-en-26-oyl-CoA dehydrogenase beta subunit